MLSRPVSHTPFCDSGASAPVSSRSSQEGPRLSAAASISSAASLSSSTPGCGIGCKGWAARLWARLPIRNPAGTMLRAAVTSSTQLLAATERMPSNPREEPGPFFTRHFQSDAFNLPGEGGTIDTSKFHAHKEDYAKQLMEIMKERADIHVPFGKLPECRAETLSPHMQVKVGVIPRHVSLVLLKLTLDKLRAALQEDEGKERRVHIDLGRKSSEEGFFTLPFKDVLNAMAHFGARSDRGGAVNIDGLHVTADLSGLKIEHLDELPQLHNFVLRSTIEGLHIDLTQIGSDHQNKAWDKLAELVSDPRTESLHDLKLNVPRQSEWASLHAAGQIAGALRAPGCDLQSLTLIGGDWTDEAKALLTNAVKERQGMERAVTLTVDGRQLGVPAQGDAHSA